MPLYKRISGGKHHLTVKGKKVVVKRDGEIEAEEWEIGYGFLEEYEIIKKSKRTRTTSVDASNKDKSNDDDETDGVMKLKAVYDFDEKAYQVINQVTNEPVHDGYLDKETAKGMVEEWEKEQDGDS